MLTPLQNAAVFGAICRPATGPGGTDTTFHGLVFLHHWTRAELGITQLEKALSEAEDGTLGAFAPLLGPADHTIMNADHDIEESNSEHRATDFEAHGSETSPEPDDIDKKRVFHHVMHGLFNVERAPVNVGRFEIIHRIGSGAMGQVHLACDPVLDRNVALKLLGRDLSAFPPEHRTNLLREAQSLACLSHPNVVQIYEVGVDENPVFIAMEYIDGDNLKDWIAAESPSWKKILSVLRSAARGLAAAHAAQIIHRDFKPENVLIGKDSGRVCVADFGLARPIPEPTTLEDDHDPATPTSTPNTGRYFGGTPIYMAPEHQDGLPTERSDQYSFCVTLYQALFDELPYPAAESGLGLDVDLRHGPRTPENAHRVPAFIIAALHRGLSPNPAARFPSMELLLEALDYERRQRLKYGGLGAAAIAIASSLTVYGSMSTEEPCREFDEQVARYWNDDVRDDLRNLAGYSEPVQQTLDDRFSGWAEQRQDACLAALDSASGSTEHDTAPTRAICLDQRLLTLGEFVRHLPESSEPWSRTHPLDSIPSLEPCQGPLPIVADRDRPLELILARAEAQLALGQHELARETAAEVQVLTERGGTNWYAVWADNIDGRSAIELGQFEDARARLQRSAFDAELQGHEYLAWKSWSRLAAIVAHGHALPEGRTWLANAEAAHRRLGPGPGYTRRTRWLAAQRANLAAFENDATAMTASKAELGMMLEKASSSPAVERLPILHSLLTLAIVENDLETLPGLIDEFERITTEAFDGDTNASASFVRPFYLAEALSTIGQAKMLTCNTEGALASFEQALEVQRRVLPPEDDDISKTHALITSALLLLGRPTEARAHAEHRFDAQQGMGKGMALLSVGLVDFGEAKFERARDRMQASAELFDPVLPQYGAVAWLGVAECDIHLGRYEDAATRISDVRDKVPGPAEGALADKLEGLVAILLGRSSDAVEPLERALRHYSTCDLLELADTRTALALALRETNPNDPRIEALEARAQSDYSARGEAGKRRHRMVRELLARS